MSFPYTPAHGKVPSFFEHIQVAGVPSKVTQQYLRGAGFKSSNDRYLIPIIKALGFVDGSGTPTDRWRRYRDKSRSGAVLAEALRETYQGLFETYPDAPDRDLDTIRNFMSAHSSAADGTLGRMVATFRVLCKLADFHDEQVAPSLSSPESGAPTPVSSHASVPRTPDPGRHMPGAQRHELEGVFLQIIPTRKNIEKARRLLEVVELSVDD